MWKTLNNYFFFIKYNMLKKNPDILLKEQNNWVLTNDKNVKSKNSNSTQIKLTFFIIWVSNVLIVNQ